MSLSTGLGGSPFTSSFFRRRRKIRTLALSREVYWGNLDNTEEVILNDWMWGVNMFAVARGQYANDQVTPIGVGSATADGITNDLWLEVDVYTGTPISKKATVSIENDPVGTAFNGVASAIDNARTLKVASLPSSRRGGNLVYDTKNKRYVLFGGYDGTIRYNEVWELSADSAYHRWSKLLPSGTPPTAKNLAAATFVRGTTSGAVDKAYMVIWGGATPSDSNEMHSLDLTTRGSETWTTITQTDAPSVRSYLTHHMTAKSTASNTSDIYLFGGWAASRVNDLSCCTFNVDSPGGVTWTTLKANGTAGNPPVRSGTGMVYDSANDRLVIMGGYNGSSYLNDAWQYSISGAAFTQLSPGGTAPAARELHSIGYDSTNQRAIIMGGWQGSVATNRNDVIQLSLTSGGEAWTEIKSNDLSNQGIVAFSSGASAVNTVNNTMVVAAMNGYDTTNKYAYAFDMDDTSTSAAPYSVTVADSFRARDAPASVYDSDRGELLLINGYSAMDDDSTISHGEHVSEVWAYDRTNNKLRAAGKGPYGIPQNEGGLAVYDSANSRIIYFGGLTGAAQKTNDVWQLKADVHGMYRATKLTPSGTKPAQRWLMAGCYDSANQRMILWGGQGTSTVLGDVWALSLTPGSEAWTQLSPTGPAPTAAWQSGYAYDSANKRLYIHGGATTFADTTYTSQLYYLDVSTTNGAWTNTGVTGGLAVRGSTIGYEPTSQRLVCFGGYDGSVVNSELRYASTSAFSSWNTQAAPNAPAPRRSSGGGIINGTFVVAVGRPVTGTWFDDVQELNASASPASWSWAEKSPAVYQTFAVSLSGLTLSTSYHWRAWVSNASTTSTASSFGGNSESAADFIIAISSTGEIKMYTGSSWAAKPVKVWNGSAWVTKPAKVWNGSAWVTTPY